jgi:hypothetical protein
MRKLCTMLLLLVSFVVSNGQEHAKPEDRVDSVEIVDRRLDDTAAGVINIKQKQEDDLGDVVATTQPDATTEKSYTIIGYIGCAIAYLIVVLLLLIFVSYLGVVILKRINK